MSTGASEILLSRANELHVNEDYIAAASLFDQAISTVPDLVRARLLRAANSMQLADYASVVSDVSLYLTSLPQIDAESRSIALYRRGRALFYLERYHEALTDFTGVTVGRLENAVAPWIRKSQLEINLHSKPDSKLHERGASTSHKLKQQTVTAAAAAKQTPAFTLAQKVRESWYQHEEESGKIVLTLYAKNLASDDVSVIFTSDTTLQATLRFADDSKFDRSWTLLRAYVVDSATYSLNPYKLEISLVKADPAFGSWDSLETVEASQKHEAALVKRQNVHSTSNQREHLKVDMWEQLDQDAAKEAEAEKPTGEAALNELFKSIYANADADTKRAMAKSYAMSGGTVLTTKWDEAKDTNYEDNIQAPQGQEVRKFAN
jgi:suppressor of G2 allele of SKP1